MMTTGKLLHGLTACAAVLGFIRTKLATRSAILTTLDATLALAYIKTFQQRLYGRKT